VRRISRGRPGTQIALEVPAETRTAHGGHNRSRIDQCCEGNRLTTTVTGSDDLEKYSAGHKVKLTGRMVREQGIDLFRVTKVEQLSITETGSSAVGLTSSWGCPDEGAFLRN